MAIVCSGAGGYNGGEGRVLTFPLHKRMKQYFRTLSSEERSRKNEMVHRINESHGMHYEKLVALGSAPRIVEHIESDLRAFFSPDRLAVVLSGRPLPELFAPLAGKALEINRSLYLPDTKEGVVWCSGDGETSVFDSFTSTLTTLELEERDFGAYRSVLVQPVTLMGMVPKRAKEYTRMACLIIASIRPNFVGENNLLVLEPLGILASNMAAALKKTSEK